MEKNKKILDIQDLAVYDHRQFHYNSILKMAMTKTA